MAAITNGFNSLRKQVVHTIESKLEIKIKGETEDQTGRHFPPAVLNLGATIERREAPSVEKKQALRSRFMEKFLDTKVRVQAGAKDMAGRVSVSAQKVQAAAKEYYGAVIESMEGHERELVRRMQQEQFITPPPPSQGRTVTDEPPVEPVVTLNVTIEEKRPARPNEGPFPAMVRHALEDGNVDQAYHLSTIANGVILTDTVDLQGLIDGTQNAEQKAWLESLQYLDNQDNEWLFVDSSDDIPETCAAAARTKTWNPMKIVMNTLITR